MKNQFEIIGVGKYQVPQVKISYVTEGYEIYKRPQITSSKDASSIFFEVWDKKTIAHHEEGYIMLLNRANKILGIEMISKGGQAGTVFDPKIVMQHAILSNSASIIICHNHPSESLNPSSADKDICNKIKAACEFHDIKLLDFLIIIPSTLTWGYYSFLDEGIL